MKFRSTAAFLVLTFSCGCSIQRVVVNRVGDALAQGAGAYAEDEDPELVRDASPFALKAVEREAFYLGLGIANLVTLYTPDMIVLGGSVMLSAHLFLPAIRARVARNCGLVPFEKTEIALASLGRDAGLIGAGAAWHQRYGD